jgi:ankyrin repeat protein
MALPLYRDILLFQLYNIRLQEGYLRSDTDFADAVKNGNVSIVKKLLEEDGSYVDAKDSWGWKVIHVACVNGHLEIARMLWEKDAVKEKKELRRALYLAMESGNKPLIQYFLDSGAVHSVSFKWLYLRELDELRSSIEHDRGSLNAQDEDGQSLLHIASTLDYLDATLILIRAGAVVDIKNSSGETPFFRSVSNGSKRVMDALLENGADINTITSYGQNALHCASTTGNASIAQFLISKGISNTYYDIHVAAALGHVDRLKAILSSNMALLDKMDMFGATPLYWAVAMQQRDAAAFLLEKGADANKKEKNGRSPMLCASQYEDKELVELLIRYGAETV